MWTEVCLWTFGCWGNPCEHVKGSFSFETTMLLYLASYHISISIIVSSKHQQGNGLSAHYTSISDSLHSYKYPSVLYYCSVWYILS